MSNPVVISVAITGSSRANGTTRAAGHRHRAGRAPTRPMRPALRWCMSMSATRTRRPPRTPEVRRLPGGHPEALPGHHRAVLDRRPRPRWRGAGQHAPPATGHGEPCDGERELPDDRLREPAGFRPDACDAHARSRDQAGDRGVRPRHADEHRRPGGGKADPAAAACAVRLRREARPAGATSSSSRSGCCASCCPAPPGPPPASDGTSSRWRAGRSPWAGTAAPASRTTSASTATPWRRPTPRWSRASRAGEAGRPVARAAERGGSWACRPIRPPRSPPEEDRSMRPDSEFVARDTAASLPTPIYKTSVFRSPHLPLLSLQNSSPR